MDLNFDPRIVQIGIQREDDEITYYEGLTITAQGTRYGTDLINECQIRIDNLTREHRDYILKATSPYFLLNNPRIFVVVNAGRTSYGTVPIYFGSVTRSAITQPPDIGLILNCQTQYDQSVNIISYSGAARSGLKTIAQKAASDLDLTLNFQALDKQISNFSFSGDALTYVRKLAEAGNLNVTIDNKVLIVKDKGVPLKTGPKIISEETGMIGIPELTESGVRVKFLLDNDTQLFQTINLKSILNPSVNGNYELFKLGFDIASRDTPFYWIADLAPLFDVGLDFAAASGDAIA